MHWISAAQSALAAQSRSRLQQSALTQVVQEVVPNLIGRSLQDGPPLLDEPDEPEDDELEELEEAEDPDELPEDAVDPDEPEEVEDPDELAELLGGTKPEEPPEDVVNPDEPENPDELDPPDDDDVSPPSSSLVWIWGSADTHAPPRQSAANERPASGAR
jgi:hypothetical protein